MSTEQARFIDNELLMHTVRMELSRGNLEHNWHSIQGIVGPDIAIIPMLKANGYGLGAVPIGKELERLGAARVGVSSLREAYDLRIGGITTPILVTDWVQPEDLPAAFALPDITLTVSHPDMLPLIEQAAQHHETHAKIDVFIDSGMNREGIWPPEDAVQTIEKIAASPYVTLEGLMTHFASPTDPDLTFTRHQLAVFNQCLNDIQARGIPLPRYIHAAEGAALMRLPETHQGDPNKRFTAVRPGNIIYGLPPGGRDFAYMTFEPRPVLSAIKARLASVKTLKDGGAVGYGRATVEPGTRLGLVAIGHTDAYRPSRLSQPAEMLVRGQRVPVVGREAMTQLVLQLPKEGEFALGDEVVIVGKQGDQKITLADLARMENDSIIRELVQLPANRLPRVMVD